MIQYKLYGSIKIIGVKKAFDAICKSANNILHIKEKITFDVNIVSSKKIRQINKKYRKIDKITDVISFANRDNQSIHVPLIGEIFICLSRAKQQAQEYNHTIQRELIFLFTHGLLHLLGFDHISKVDETKMLKTTNKIINKAQINSKYIIK